MKKKISAADCKGMFADKFSSLTMKDLGIELKHFLVGTAPEKPSFLVNQENLKKKLTEKFCDFFDEEKSKGLEIIFLQSNYGNGKSHLLRTIFTFFNEYENVITKEIAFKQEETDLKKIILQSISPKVVKDAATYFVEEAAGETLSEEKTVILLEICEKYSIDIKLADVLYEAARSSNATVQVQAISVLKNNYLAEYLKNFNCKTKDLNNTFFYDVIRLISVYLKKVELYLVIVFDEYEHVFLWKNGDARKRLYEDIKMFTENVGKFSNMFFAFAESITAQKIAESQDDPAFASRKVKLTLKIEDISSEGEADKLFKMVLKRYEKYYSLSFEPYIDDIKKKINEDHTVQTSYRSYIKTIMAVLDEFRTNPPKKKAKRSVMKEVAKPVKNDPTDIDDVGIEQIIDKWKKATSITKKTMLCEMLEFMLQNVGETILLKSKRKGEYLTEKGNKRKRFYIVVTEKPSLKDIEKRYVSATNVKTEEEAIYFLYPFVDEIIKLNNGDKVIYYEEKTIIDSFKLMHVDRAKYDNLDLYLSVLNKRDCYEEEN